MDIPTVTTSRLDDEGRRTLLALVAAPLHGGMHIVPRDGASCAALAAAVVGDDECAVPLFAAVAVNDGVTVAKPNPDAQADGADNGILAACLVGVRHTDGKPATAASARMLMLLAAHGGKVSMTPVELREALGLSDAKSYAAFAVFNRVVIERFRPDLALAGICVEVTLTRGGDGRNGGVRSVNVRVVEDGKCG